jgi:hypothetical protein
MLLLWPFILPTTLLSEPVRPAGPAPRHSARATRLEALAIAVDEAWAQGDPAASRERDVTRSFVEEQRRREDRLGALEDAIAGAAPSIRPRLELLRKDTEHELDNACVLLDEIVAQLTLLHFSGLVASDRSAGDRVHIEDLLARIEALASLTPVSRAGEP